MLVPTLSLTFGLWIATCRIIIVAIEQTLYSSLLDAGVAIIFQKVLVCTDSMDEIGNVKEDLAKYRHLIECD